MELGRRVKSFNTEARLLNYMSQRSRHFLHLRGHEYKPMENVGYMVMELGEGNLRQFLVGSPMNDGTRRMLWKQIVTILRDLEDAGIGERESDASLVRFSSLFSSCGYQAG